MVTRISSTTKEDGTRRIVVKHDTLPMFAKVYAAPMDVAFDRIGFRVTVSLCDKDAKALPHGEGIALGEAFEFHVAPDGDTPLEERASKVKADFDAVVDERASKLFVAAVNRQAAATL